MPVAMETTLFLLLSMGTWAQSSMAMYTSQASYDFFGTVNVTDPNLSPMHTSQGDYDSFGTEGVTEPNLSSMTFPPVRNLEKDDDPGDHIRALTPSDVTSLETSTDGLLSVPTVLQEVSTNKSVVFLNVSDTTNDSAVFIATNSPGGQVVTDESLTAGSPKPTDEATDATLALATSSPESSSEAAGSTFILTTGSSGPTSGAMDSTFDPATGSLEPSSGATGPPLIPSTGSLDLSKGTSELSVSRVTSSLKTPKRIVVLPTALVERSTTTSLKDSTKISGSSPNPNKGMKGTLLPVIVTLLVFLVLVVLLLLWRQRQKRHSGVLSLNGATKRNGVDAWAGRAPVSGEEVLTVTVADTQNDKGSEVPQGEVCGRRPTLTTFFSRRKSCQGSVALEDLGPGAAPGLKPEEESLIGAGDAVEAPTLDGLEAGGGEPPSSCE